MNTLLTKVSNLLVPGVFLLLLGLSSTTANAQCFGGGVDDGSGLTTTFTGCTNEQIKFFSNSLGYTNDSVRWTFTLNGVKEFSTQVDVTRSFQKAGTVTVQWNGYGTAGSCTETFTIIIQPSPVIKLTLLDPDTQCFESNEFCLLDSTLTDPSSSIIRETIVTSDGDRYDYYDGITPHTWCFSIKDPLGGFFDMYYEAEDSTGCVSTATFKDYVYVTRKLGVQFVNRTPPPNPGCDSTLGRFENKTELPLNQIAEFCWYFGDGDTICGDSLTNTEWWYGKNNDNLIEHMYTINGTFDGRLYVRSIFDCEETFTWKAAVTNIVLKPVIIADKDSSCVPDNPVNFRLKDGPPAGASAWLWNFGDPPSGPLNTNDEDWEVSHSYGTGPWMISLRIIAGPCDVTVYDTITKIGPGSTIEVPFVRVLEKETYQCIITDSVHFVNNSSFYHNDNFQYDEDSVVFQYKNTVRYWQNPQTGFYYLRQTNYWSGELQSIDTINLTDTAQFLGVEVWYDSGKDSLAVRENGVITYVDKTFYGYGQKRRYVFNYTVGPPAAGDQTAVDPAVSNRGMNPNVWRVWDFGDQYAPQCTTDSRGWVNKNIGLNCAWSIDSLPVHWYTPWDEIYREQNNGNFYRTPYAKSLFNRRLRTCYRVNVYADTTVVIQGDTVLTIPMGQSYTYRGVTIGPNDVFPTGYLGNWRIRRPPANFVAPKIYREDSLFVVVYPNGDTSRYWQWMIGRESLTGSYTWTVTEFDMDFYIPAGVTVHIGKLASPGGGGTGGTSRVETGPKTITIEADEQFTIYDWDSIRPIVTIEENDNDTFLAQPSLYYKDSAMYDLFGNFLGDTTVIRSKLFIDSAAHREDFFLERAQCFQVELWHKDTVHPLMCEATSNKSLALIPPNANNVKITSGIPCPMDGDNFSYILEFDLGETKPGCTQQWFAVNYDSIADPTAFNVFNQGAVLAPPKPGSPIPFVLPYMLVGNYGTKFVKGYSPGEIGNDPNLRDPNGSFTVGIIVGNGQPNPNGGPPACLDTMWYGDMFRILYLNADFTIVSPTNDPKAVCAGGTAYYRINEPIQDSIKVLRWNWGYQGIGRGVNLATYIEQFEYYEQYPGPSPTRNDKDVVYNGEDWLYNYVIRQELSDVTGLKIIDTIVTAIIHDWEVVANTDNADKVVQDIFEQLGFDLNNIPPEDVPLFLGDGTFGCIDTTGLSQFFTFGIKAYSEKEDPLVYRIGSKRYRYTDETKTNSVLVATILHHRDSSLIGWDSLELDTNMDGKLDKLTGLWKYTYRHPKYVVDPCTGERSLIYEASNGPMLPNLFLNNTVGCEKRGAALLNVGFLNQFKLLDTALCQGVAFEVDDSLRYWQYGDFMWPEDYPIDPRDFWHNPDRFVDPNLEWFGADWDASDGLDDPIQQSIGLFHTYDEPGIYQVTIVSHDSIGCYDTVKLKAYVTDIEPLIGLSQELLNCNWIVDFQDSSIVMDPCRISDTCQTGIERACDSVISWLWDFGDGTKKSVLKDPSHVYTKGGYFDVKLIVKTLLGCEDSIVRRIYIPGPQPEFEFRDVVWKDSAFICVGDTIAMRNLSSGEKFDPTWDMRWGDGGISNPGDSGTIFKHQYNQVGVFELYLIQQDRIPGTNIRCHRIFPDTNPDLLVLRKIKVIVLPSRGAELEIADSILCPDEITQFIAHADSIYEKYTWEFFKVGAASTNDTIKRNKPDSIVSNSFSDPGRYMVVLTPTYDPVQPFVPVCPDKDTGYLYVDSIMASFRVDSTKKPDFCFINESVNGVTYSWTFEDESTQGTSTEENPCYNWSDRDGEWEVCLTATSPNGCVDDTCLTIVNTFQRGITVYNVFSPTGDLINDQYVIDGKGLEEFHIKIYNRWGELVFESTDINYSWNGQVMNSGAICPGGTYFYIINYKFFFEEENEGKGPIEGQVELIRD